MSATRVEIVGASGRAAAASARRAGLVPTVVDLFADRDTRLLGDFIRCPLADYPHALPELVRHLPPGPVFYTGGLENHPDVLDRLAADRELLGNGSRTVEPVRNPARLRELLADTGLRFPLHFAEPPTGIECLIKHQARSGGLGISKASGGRKPPVEPASARGSTSASHPPLAYYEEFIPGQPMSAQFVNDTFLGATEQLVNEPWLHAPPFHYAGNIGPAKLSPSLFAAFAAAAQRLNLRGPWGIDFILQNATAYVLEVNPRYTAAMEVLELTAQTPLAFHSCSLLLGGAGRREPDNNCIGKAIYYAPLLLHFPPTGPWDADLVTPWNPWRIPTFADIPHPGEPFDPGQPVLTFFATDSTPAAVRAKLMATARDLDALFARESHP